MVYVLIVMMSSGVSFQQIPNLTSCEFAGKNAVALAYEIEVQSTYRCVPLDKTKWFSK